MSLLIGYGRRVQSRFCAQTFRQIARPCSFTPHNPLHSYSSQAAQHGSQDTSKAATSTGAPMTIFSGIQPTGIPHLGNYLGALRQWVRLQDAAPPSTNLYYSIVDLHSLTSRTQTPSDRRLAKRETLAALLACGLDPARSTIYHQSSVLQHAELHWILSCDASTGALGRMTQWKSKLDDDASTGSTDTSILSNSVPNPRSAERLKLGLFSYPVLQAADVLLYAATHVPVGEDQVQHIEFARDTAAVFNAAYGRAAGDKGQARQILTPPECLVSPAKRVMSLAEPTKKMSKSHALSRSRILISDSADSIRKKIRAAVTDSREDISYEPQLRPGVSNLLDIIAYLEDDAGAQQTPLDIANEMQSMSGVQGSRLRVLKDHAANVIERHLGPVRARYESLMGEGNGKRLDETAAEGTSKALIKAEATMKEVREAVGIS